VGGSRDNAVAAFQEATRLDPDFAEAWDRLGTVLLEYQERIDEAFAAFERAAALRPDYLPAMGSALWLAQPVWDWPTVAKYSEPVLRRAADQPHAVSPFQLMSLPGATRADLLAHARALSATIAPREPMRHDPARFDGRSRLRVGYLSSDFHGHPVAYL